MAKSATTLPVLAAIAVAVFFGYKAYQGVVDWKQQKLGNTRPTKRTVHIQRDDGGLLAEAKDNFGLVLEGRFFERAPKRAKGAGYAVGQQSPYTSRKGTAHKKEVSSE